MQESQSEIEDLRTKLAQSQSEASALAHEKSSLLESTSVSSKETSELLDKVRELESARGSLETELGQTKRDLEAAQDLASQVDPLKSELSQASQANSEKEAKIGSLALDLKTAQEAKEVLSQEKASVQASLEEMRSTSSDSRQFFWTHAKGETIYSFSYFFAHRSGHNLRFQK